MRKVSSLVLMLLLSAALCGCGGGGGVTEPPPAQPKITNFAYLQATPNQPNEFTPMLGKFTVTGNNVQFSSVPAAYDSSTGQPASGDFYSIALSPDGKRATFDMFGGTMDAPSDQLDIWVANVSGNNVTLTQVTNDIYDDVMPQFSPDGTKVIFMSCRPAVGGTRTCTGGVGRWEVVIRNADGNGVEQVLQIPAATIYAGEPTFSPDGRTIALAVTGAIEGIYLVNADGTNPHPLLSTPPSCACIDELPAFSLDGKKVFFNRRDYSNSPQLSDIYSVNVDGSNPTMLTDGVGLNSDAMPLNIVGLGERVLFSSNRGNPTDPSGNSFDIYSMKTDGTGITNLTSNPLYDGFYAEWYEGPANASAQQAKAESRLLHRPTFAPPMRPNWH